MKPADAHALHRLALACVHTGEMDRARDYLEQALSAAPERAQMWEHAGLLAASAGELAKAETMYRRALALSGDTASLHRNMADCLRLAGRPVDAIAHYTQAVAIDPGLHHAARALARIHTELGKLDEAADWWLRASTMNGSVSVLDDLDLVAALAKTHRTNQLETRIEQIRTRFADDAEALKSLAFVLNTHDCFNEALSVARQGLALAPHHPLLHHNAARALSILGKTAESLPHSVAAAQLMPDNAYLQFHLAGVLLALGDFEAGWKQYRWFYALPGTANERMRPAFPQWRGESVAGSRFLLVGEQGRGDEIQALRFVEWLHRQGATVDVLVSEPIASLARTMSDVHDVFVSLPPGPYDFWCHMLRMPEHMKLRIAMLPAVTIPYLTARPDRRRYWQTCIDALAARGKRTRNRRVGLVWAGNPAHALDRFRSVALDALRPLLAISGITWYALQKGERERDGEPFANGGDYDLHTLGPAIDDFADTLAILPALDLLITVDTSVAHLAGAAGHPVWVLVPAYTEWRWFSEHKRGHKRDHTHTDTPWYPSMRVFRQSKLGVWDDVIDKVRHALLEWRDA
ncbi:tetratricopeptide repeat protein [Paraburkholderia xenovorans]|uniref:tetratricopeptide repeat protein n=1 Tax=Paraburkholderia xenovorans TaxID=36873 RepID=UPI0038BADABA